MVALTILVVVIGGLSLLSAKTSERARLAETLAQRNYTIVQQMNRLNALPFDSLRVYTLGRADDTIPSGIPTIRFLRRDTVYYISGIDTGTPPRTGMKAATAGDTLLIEAKVTILPLTSIRRDTVYRDSIALRRRNPRLTSPLNY
jgi:hypothetical protein